MADDAYDPIIKDIIVERRFPNILGNVRDVKVRQIPPNPFSDKARNMTGAKTEGSYPARAIRAHESAKQKLPTNLSGRGPYRSIRIPNGSVAALNRKEPMVKPKFSISSWAVHVSHGFDKVSLLGSDSFVDEADESDEFDSVHRCE